MNIEIEMKNKNLPFMATILLYLTQLILYLAGLISGTVFVKFLLFMSVMFVIFLFVIRNIVISKRAFVYSTILSSLLLIYELPLTLFGENDYLVTRYSEPEELIKGTSIYLLSVKIDHLSNVNNEHEIRAMYNDNQRVYDVVPGTNFKFYKDKNSSIFEFIGLYKSEVEKSFENVTTYLKTNNHAIDEFFARDENVGSSAGLALVLSSFIDQGKFQNNVPIAVTGAISKIGEVKKVGGIKEKIQIANEGEFSFMIIPIGNLTEANEVKERLNLSIKIIGVRDVDEAIKIIKKYN
ncbi:hypothetical protein B4U37_19590 [Sutcliffiella horikoshii]|uniref:Lon proteolytic domain-containing protein n=1 Tax=Sutcliffiella horikoshii TaxID=79883 RepID=A0ABM6KNP3_9BACI|nr:S16 family serine protease [Sutcliffiella horikoshii]ART78104.1 hypothetical protein B4U37_19590 [Sutcliffiella horikoshii]